MEFAARDLTAAQKYKLLSGFIIPRPIAWITSLGEGGVVNAAPFSFFNVFAEEPPVVMIGFNRRPDGTLKDTIRNIDRTGEWVVNIADEPLAEAMHRTSGVFPADVSEAEIEGLALAKSAVIAPPRLRDAPFSLECRTMQAIDIGTERRLVLGEGLHLHVRDDVIDPATLRVRDENYFPIGRLYGNRYVRTRDRITFPPAKGGPVGG